MRLFSLVAGGTLLASACTMTIAGNGQTTSGAPVTGRYTQTAVDASTFNLDVLIISAHGVACTANEDLSKGQTIWSLPLSCQNGVKGRMTLTADYVNGRDTVIYRLSNGERGRLVFGASLQVSGA